MSFIEQGHEMSHTGERPQACFKCDTFLTESGYLKKHELAQKGEAYAGYKCDKAFKHRTYLKIHDWN